MSFFFKFFKCIYLIKKKKKNKKKKIIDCNVCKLLNRKKFEQFIYIAGAEITVAMYQLKEKPNE